MQKELIKKRFEKSLLTYNNNAVVQKKMAKKLADLIQKKSYDNILELGCGTGFLTKEIIKKCGFQSYYAVDIVGGCKDYIEQISKDIIFEESDIEKYVPMIVSDLVISNASLQWIEDLKEFVNNYVYDYLTEDGEVIFTLFGKENFKEFKPFVNNPLNYYGVNEIKELFDRYNVISVDESLEVLEFDNPINVLHHIKYTGVNALMQMSWTKSDLDSFIKEYPRANDGRIKLTYNPVYIKLGK